MTYDNAVYLRYFIANPYIYVADVCHSPNIFSQLKLFSLKKTHPPCLPDCCHPDERLNLDLNKTRIINKNDCIFSQNVFREVELSTENRLVGRA